MNREGRNGLERQVETVDYENSRLFVDGRHGGGGGGGGAVTVLWMDVTGGL